MEKLNALEGPKSKNSETKFLNINNFEVRGSQICIYPNYSERDLTKEIHLELYSISLEMLSYNAMSYRESE